MRSQDNTHCLARLIEWICCFLWYNKLLSVCEGKLTVYCAQADDSCSNVRIEMKHSTNVYKKSQIINVFLFSICIALFKPHRVEGKG